MNENSFIIRDFFWKYLVEKRPFKPFKLYAYENSL